MQQIIQGKNLNLYLTLNSVAYPVGHATDCTINLSADTQETTTQNSLKGKTFNYTGKYSYKLSLKGFTNFIDIAHIGTFQDAILLSAKLFFVFTDGQNIQWSGFILMDEVDLDSPVAGLSSFTNSMTGDGELIKVTTNVPVTPAAPVVTIVDQFGDVIATVSAPGTYPVLRFDTIDEGDAFGPAPQLIIIEA